MGLGDYLDIVFPISDGIVNTVKSTTDQETIDAFNKLIKFQSLGLGQRLSRESDWLDGVTLLHHKMDAENWLNKSGEWVDIEDDFKTMIWDQACFYATKKFKGED